MSDGLLQFGSTGEVGDGSTDGHTGRISPTMGVGETAGVEVRRNLKGFLALIGRLAVIGRFLARISSGVCGSSNSGGRFFKGGRSPRSDSSDEHNVESPEENEAVVQVMFSLEGGSGWWISPPFWAPGDKDTCRSTFSRESGGRVVIDLGCGERW
jgi:hypothetical protein